MNPRPCCPHACHGPRDLAGSQAAARPPLLLLLRRKPPSSKSGSSSTGSRQVAIVAQATAVADASEAARVQAAYVEGGATYVLGYSKLVVSNQRALIKASRGRGHPRQQSPQHAFAFACVPAMCAPANAGHSSRGRAPRAGAS